jgi:HEXXH motif-containing protein
LVRTLHAAPDREEGVLSSTPLSFLCLPEPGDKTIATYYQRVRAIALKQLLTFPVAQLESRNRRVVNEARRVIAGILTSHKALVMEAMSNIDVYTPLLILDVGPELAGESADDLLFAAFGALFPILGHLAPKGMVPETILWDLPVKHVPDSTAHRVLYFEPEAKGMLVDPMGMEVRLADDTPVRLKPMDPHLESQPGMRVDHPFHRLSPDLPRLQFSLYDSNPLSMFEMHPDKDGNQITLSDLPVERWLSAYREALEIIRVTLPGWYDELKWSMKRLVPVGYLPERHLSASYREAPGLAYLTLCDNPLTIAEAIVHETQHSKVNLLSWLDPVVHNGMTCWTQSPVRPDLRPLWGVLLAVHAFVPVAAMHDRLAEMNHPVTQTERFPRRRAEVIAGNHRGMVAVVENADPSPAGKRMIDEMYALHEWLRLKCPPAPPGMNIDPDILPPG